MASRLGTTKRVSRRDNKDIRIMFLTTLTISGIYIQPAALVKKLNAFVNRLSKLIIHDIYIPLQKLNALVESC